MAPRTSPRKRATVKYTEEDDQDVKPKATGTKTAGTKRKQADSAEEDEKPSAKPAPDPKKTKTASKKAAKVEDDAMPLAERTAVSGMKKAMYIGAHVSAAGGVQNAVTNAVHIGANAFALFLKSQRKWDNPPLADDARLQFADRCKSHSYDAAAHSLPHGSYLVNLAARDAAKAAQAYAGFADDLARCDALGIRLYNFHPGNTNGEPRPEAIARIAGQLNRAHAATKSVVTVLENMAGSGNVVGSAWEDLRDIIALVDDKSRVGVCIDTCHAFAAGHDLRTPEAFAATMAQFDDIVGRDYLRAVHREHAPPLPLFG